MVDMGDMVDMVHMEDMVVIEDMADMIDMVDMEDMVTWWRSSSPAAAGLELLSSGGGELY